MKNIIVILLILLVSFSGCKKTDEKIEDKIVGHWKAETSNYKVFFLSNSTSDYIPRNFECTADGKFIDYHRTSAFLTPCDNFVTATGFTYGERPCTTAYQINNSNLEILVQVDSNNFEYKGIKIIKITNKKLILLEVLFNGRETEYTYKKEK